MINLKFFSLQSGSNGNSHLIQSNNTSILIDSGLSGVRTKNILAEAGFSIEDVSGVLITHEHDDHVSGAGVLSRKFKTPVYINRATFKMATMKMKQIDESLLHFIDGPFCIGDIVVTPFKICHDAADPLGYVLKSDGKKISVITDTGVITDEVMALTKNSDFFYVEANFDPIMLKHGPYTPALQERVRGDFGHLSNFECAEYLINAIGDRTKAVMIGHISLFNNGETLAKLTVENAIAEAGLDVPVFVSSRFRPSVVIEI